MSGRGLMDGPGDLLLAGAGLAFDQDRGRGVGDATDQVEDVVHPRALLRMFQNRCRSPICERRAANSSCKVRSRSARFDQEAEVLRVRGLGEEVVGPHTHGLNGLVDAAVAGGHDDRHRQASSLNLLDQLHAVDLGHSKIGDDDAVRLLLKHRQGLGAVGGQVHPDSQSQAEQLLKRVARVFIVLDEKNPPSRIKTLRQVSRVVAGA